MEDCCQTWQGLNSQPLDHQSDTHQIEPSRPAKSEGPDRIYVHHNPSVSGCGFVLQLYHLRNSLTSTFHASVCGVTGVGRG